MSNANSASEGRGVGSGVLRPLVVVGLAFTLGAVSGVVLSQASSSEDGGQCVDTVHRYGELQRRAGVRDVFDDEPVNDRALRTALEIVSENPSCFPEELVDRVADELQEEHQRSAREAFQ